MTAPFPFWVSAVAVAWALDHAPDVPPALVSTLVAVARHADQNGKGAYPSVEAVAAKTRKSVRQTRRDISQLRDLGLLLAGDQSLVEHLPADRRPVVYDIPLHLRRGDTHDRSRGDMDDRAGCHPCPDGVSPVSPKEDSEQDRKNPVEQTSLSGEHEPDQVRRVSVPKPREREARVEDQKFPSSEHRILAKYGWHGPNADGIISRLREEHDIYGVGWYVTADKNGTLPDRIQELVDEELAARPDWSGPRPVNGRWPTSA